MSRLTEALNKVKQIKISATVLDGIKVGDSKKVSPFGEAKSAVPKGFFYSQKKFYFDVPAGVIPNQAIIYSDGNNSHSLFMYDRDSNSFIAKTTPFKNYTEYDAKNAVAKFMNNTVSITEKEAKELIEKDKGTFEGTRDEIIDFLKAEENTDYLYRIQRI